jgi:hypothetical protein
MLGGEKSLVVEERASTFYPYVEAVYSCPLFGQRFAMVIQTVYCESRAKIAPTYEALMAAVRRIPKAQKNAPVTIDITAPPKTSEGSLYEHVYSKDEGET